MKVYRRCVRPVSTTGYRIKDVAERSGFSAATLRYYEDIGLLPAAERTPSGYRSYGDATLDRLAFIARAKQLGCSLDEIADLTTAWDGGRCGPIQDRLRDVVAAKLEDAGRQIDELRTLSDELRAAAEALEQHRPEGACDERCGCVSDPTHAVSGAAPSLEPIELTAKLADQPIACTLGASELHGRVEDWRDVLAHVDARQSIAGGVRATFAPTAPLDRLMGLTTAEQRCCQFLAFAITVDTRGVALEVTAPDEAVDVVHALFGTP